MDSEKQQTEKGIRESQASYAPSQEGDKQLLAQEGDSARQAPPLLLHRIRERLEQRNNSVGEQDSTAALLKALRHPEWEIRERAVRFLTTREEKGVREALHQALHDEHRLVRAAAVRALARQGVALEQWLTALSDSDWEVREMAVIALAEAGGAALPLLRVAERDPNSQVRMASTAILQQRQQEQREKRLSRVQAMRNKIAAFFLIWGKQIRIINKSVWAGPPLLLLLWYLQTLFSGGERVNLHHLGLELALMTTVIAAAGSAFLYGHENDGSFEITLSTPTSIRLIMLTRFLLVIFYNFALAAVASAVVALTHGGSWWEIVQLWLGPMLLISSLTLTLSLLLSSWTALLGGVLLELSQSINFGRTAGDATLISPDYWQTTPLIILLAVLCLLIALFYLPRQQKLNI